MSKDTRYSISQRDWDRMFNRVLNRILDRDFDRIANEVMDKLFLPQPSFESLPPEIILRIIPHLSLTSRVELSSVSKRCRALILKTTRSVVVRPEMQWGVERFSMLCRLTSLVSLDVSGLDIINNQSLRSVSSLTKLTILFLNRCRNIRDLTPLSSLVQLKKLQLSDCLRLNNITCHLLSGLPRLEQLCLDRSPVDDSGMLALGRMTTLHTLSLAGTNVTSVGVSHLTRLLNLNNLNLRDTSIYGNLNFLIRLTTLRILNIEKTLAEPSIGLLQLTQLKVLRD